MTTFCPLIHLLLIIMTFIITVFFLFFFILFFIHSFFSFWNTTIIIVIMGAFTVIIIIIIIAVIFRFSNSRFGISLNIDDVNIKGIHIDISIFSFEQVVHTMFLFSS